MHTDLCHSHVATSICQPSHLVLLPPPLPLDPRSRSPPQNDRTPKKTCIACTPDKMSRIKLMCKCCQDPFRQNLELMAVASLGLSRSHWRSVDNEICTPVILLFTFSPLSLCHHTTLLAADVQRLNTPMWQHSSSTNCIYPTSIILYTCSSPQNNTMCLATSVDPV
ncbi:hypothetical protein BC827DRAFT_1229410 [Russula dissimulans]|nr:hypothetical protein BC827DRAFT_1229410 [Russula dissimulans]